MLPASPCSHLAWQPASSSSFWAGGGGGGGWWQTRNDSSGVTVNQYWVFYLQTSSLPQWRLIGKLLHIWQANYFCDTCPFTLRRLKSNTARFEVIGKILISPWPVVLFLLPSFFFLSFLFHYSVIYLTFFSFFSLFIIYIIKHILQVQK